MGNFKEFKGDYLRVRTPLTSDGVSPIVENDRIKYREDFLPLSAKRMLEKKNEKLPSALRKKIEVVSNEVRPTIPVDKSFNKGRDEDELSSDDFQEEEHADLETAPVKNKGGRPKKTA